MRATRNMHSLGRALLAIPLLAAVPAYAAPSYVGTWASDIAQCTVDQSRQEAPLVLQEKRFDQHETHCTFKSIAGENEEWNVKSDCQIEGSAEPYDFTLTVSGDTLSITDEFGTRDLLRCR